MIVVDTSALVRIFMREPGFERFERRLSEAERAFVPVPCFVEFSLLRRIGPQRQGWIRLLLSEPNISAASLEAEHTETAIRAATEFGKGSGHPAQLNFGDCLVYAVAIHRDLPLLYAGEDFSLTDVFPALPKEQ